MPLPRPLFEVVLYNPVETVLAQWIRRAETPEGKEWIAKNFRNWLVKSSPNLHKLPYLPINATPEQKRAFEFNDLYDIRLTPETEGHLEHIIDFLNNNINLPRLPRMSVENVLQAADLWVKQLVKRGLKKPDDPKQVKTIMEFPGGFRMVDLIGAQALAREGALMGHCVGGQSYADFVKSGQGHIYSLRDNDNEPHATIQVENGKTQQIKGRGNMSPVRRYWPMLRDFFDKTGIEVDLDHRNVGLLQIFDPDEQRRVTMTQDQFKDLVLDPNNKKGETLLTNYDIGRRGDDLSLGLFSALYGTNRLSDSLVKIAFRDFPDYAVQVVEHFGKNHFTPEQVVMAFTSMTSRNEEIGRYYKALLTVIKPDVATVTTINAGLERNRADNDVIFVSSVSQVLPDTYIEMLGGEAGIQNELKQPNVRAAGPFFVYMSGKIKVDNPETVATMIEQAFRYTPADAIKKIRRVKFVLDHDNIVHAFQGLGYRYWGSDDADKPLEWLIEYVKPDESLLNELFGVAKKSGNHFISGSENFFAKLLLVARKVVPQSLSKETTETALMNINDDQMIEQYLVSEPTPDFPFQKYLLEKDNRNSYEGFHARLQWIQNINPAIFKELLKLLKPKDIPTSKEDYRNIKNKANPAGPTIQKIFKRKLTPEEQTKAHSAARRKAIDNFCKNLGGAIREPDVHIDSPLNNESPKFKVGEQAFATMGKSKLFEVAVVAIDRRSTKERMHHNGMSNYLTTNQIADFLKNLSRLHLADIIRLIDSSGHSNDLFGHIINYQPALVPLLMRGQKLRRYVPYGEAGQWGKLEWKFLKKDKAFEALQYVWADPKVPQGYKNDFTLKVFKRFKPSPANLMTMLHAANNEEATTYVLKKTKNPSVELVNYVTDTFPGLVFEDVKTIPPASLAHIFEKRPKLANNLMSRDIRGWGADGRWGNAYFHSKIDRGSEVYAKYEAAAKAAGKDAEFATYIHQGELDELMSERLKAGNHVGAREFLTQHLNEFSVVTLTSFGMKDESGTSIVLYFKTFTPLKLAKLCAAGLFTAYHRRHLVNNAHSSVKISSNGILKQVDQHKLHQTIMVLIKHKNKNAMDTILQGMATEGPRPDDAIIKALIESNVADFQSKVKQFINDGMSDEMKDFIADHLPHSMERLKTPTPHMVERLYDLYGSHLDQNGYVPYFFSHTVSAWFSGDSYWFKYQPNPVAERLLKAEAMKRKGVAASITLAMFKELKSSAEKAKTDDHISAGSPKVNDVMRTLHRKHD